MARLNVGFYPYTYARVSVMKGSLIPRREYAKLLKMKLSEITHYLSEHEYRREIDELATSHQGLALTEAALRLNLERTLTKLRRISQEGLLELLNSYLKRWDVHNLKTILRAHTTGMPKDDVLNVLIAGGSLSKDYLSDLTSKDSVKDVLKAIDSKLVELYGDGNLFAVENELDRRYYQEMMDLSRNIRGQGHIFAQFLRKEITNLNILTLIRLKGLKLDEKEIKSYLLLDPRDRSFDALLKLETPEAVVKALSRKHLIPKVAEDSLLTLELVLKKKLLEESLLLLHQNPLTVDVILAYLFSKEVEINNLQILIKGKQLGLDEDLLEKGLVMGRTYA